MPVKLIIFDLDGTLIDSSVDITNAINYAIGPYGILPITVQETINLVGEGISRLMEKIIEKEEINVDRDLLIKRFLEYYSAHLVDKTVLYPGVKKTLQSLDGYKKAVISNKRESLSVEALEKLGVARYFDLIAGSDTTQERKPSPVPVFYVLSKLGINPEDAVIVGDSNYDIEAGKAAGIKTVAVTYGYRPVDLLKDSDFKIDRMDELPGVLDRILR